MDKIPKPSLHLKIKHIPRGCSHTIDRGHQISCRDEGSRSDRSHWFVFDDWCMFDVCISGKRWWKTKQKKKNTWYIVGLQWHKGRTGKYVCACNLNKYRSNMTDELSSVTLHLQQIKVLIDAEKLQPSDSLVIDFNRTIEYLNPTSLDQLRTRYVGKPV